MTKFDVSNYLRLMEIPVHKMSQEEADQIVEQTEIFSKLFSDVMQELANMVIPISFKEDLVIVNKVLTYLLEREAFGTPELFKEYHERKGNAM